jgi:hypothetical protein
VIELPLRAVRMERIWDLSRGCFRALQSFFPPLEGTLSIFTVAPGREQTPHEPTEFRSEARKLSQKPIREFLKRTPRRELIIF